MKRSFADNATSSSTGGLCSQPECLNPARSGGNCWGHARQLHRTGTMRKLQPSRPQMTPLQRLKKTADDLADADSEDDEAYRRALDNHCKAALGYARSLGWSKA